MKRGLRSSFEWNIIGLDLEVGLLHIDLIHFLSWLCRHCLKDYFRIMEMKMEKEKESSQ